MVLKWQLPIVLIITIATWINTQSLPYVYGAAGGSLTLFLWLTWRYRRWKRNRLKRSTLAEIDVMDGIEFEHYLRELFVAQGYRVQVTTASGDYGADLVMYDGEAKIVVQAKRYSKPVGVKAVQEIVAAIRYYEADEAWVVTNHSFTPQAHTLAEANDVYLIGREELIEFALQLNDQFVERCPKCGGVLRKRNGRDGPFYGCSNYPDCRYARR